MKSFLTEAEMKDYGKYFGKQEIEEVLLNGKRTFLCGTNLAFTDEADYIAEDALKAFAKIFGLDKELSDVIERDPEGVSLIADSLFTTIEKILDVEITSVYDFF